MVRRSNFFKVIRNKLTAAHTKMKTHMLNITYPARKNIWVMEMTKVNEVSCTLSILSVSSVSHFCKISEWDKRTVLS